MVVIRLTRVGKKNSPAYRVVVADRRRAVKRKFIEVIGHYNPISKPKEIVIDKDRALFWMGNGAVPSNTVRNLMVDLEILKKSEKINKVYGKEKTKKEMKEGAKEPKPAAPTEETLEAEVNEEPADENTEAPAEEAATEEATEDKTAEVIDEPAENVEESKE